MSVAKNKTPNIKSKDLVLGIHLSLRSVNNRSVADVNHTIPLTSILEPMFIKDGAKRIEQIVEMLGTSVFNTLVRNYFTDQVELTHIPQTFSDNKIVIDTLTDGHEKLALENSEAENLRPVVSDETNLVVELEDVDKPQEEIPEEYDLEDEPEDNSAKIPNIEMTKETIKPTIPPPNPTIVDNSNRKPQIRF